MQLQDESYSTLINTCNNQFKIQLDPAFVYSRKTIFDLSEYIYMQLLGRVVGSKHAYDETTDILQLLDKLGQQQRFDDKALSKIVDAAIEGADWMNTVRFEHRGAFNGGEFFAVKT
jgi:hypothetical protein